MDLITQYSEIILKKIMMKIQKDKKSKERAELVKLEMAETGAGVRSSRHWKAAANITMRVNRLELLKANIGLELIATFDDLDKYFSNELTKAGLKELQRQAGILDMTISKSDYGKRVEQVLNSSFKAEGFATFSDNLWMYQAELKSDLDKLLVRSVTMGRNPKQLAPELAKYLTQEGRENTKFNTQRLMVTETTRVQTGIQKQSYLDMEFEEFVFISEPTACRICLPLNDKTFRVDDMSPGLNCAPMHPFCRCSTAPYIDRQ